MTNPESSLTQVDIHPNLSRGQHMLIDRQVLEDITRSVSMGNVLEIGPGTGNLTRYLATRANKVVGIEIDYRFSPFLAPLAEQGVEIIYDDALRQGLLKRIVTSAGEWQVVGNIPYQISPDLLQRLTEIPIDSATLLVGQAFADTCRCQNPSSEIFSRSSFIATTYFDVIPLGEVQKRSFSPQPATQSQLIGLFPRDKHQYRDNPGLHIAKQLLDSLGRSKPQSVEKVLLANSDTQRPGKYNLDKATTHRYDRRVNQQRLNGMVKRRELEPESSSHHSVSARSLELTTGLSRAELSATFRSLDNQAIRNLVTYLRTLGWGGN